MLETRAEDLAWEKGRWFVRGDPERGAEQLMQLNDMLAGAGR